MRSYHQLKIKRAYEDAAATDGNRILVDRLWPRGLSKETLSLDDWDKSIAPTPALRTWFGHMPERFEEFSRSYEAELDANPHASAFAAHCHELLKDGNVTLVYGAKSPTCNHALILRDWVLRHDESPTTTNINQKESPST